MQPELHCFWSGELYMKDLLENIFLGIIIIISLAILGGVIFIVGAIVIIGWRITIPLIILGVILGIIMTIADR